MRKGGRGHLGCVYFHEHPANSLSLLNSLSLIWALWHQHSALEQKKEAGRERGSPGQQAQRPPALTHDAVGPIGRRRARRGAVMIRAAAVEGGHRRKTGVDVC